MQFKKHLIRHIRFIEFWSLHQWKIKVYYISEYGTGTDESFISIAKRIAATEISTIDSSSNHHHAAFLTIHVSRLFNQIIFDWWAEENELRHLVFKADTGSPTNFINITSTGEAFCIWELKVIGFERDSWTENMLKNETQNLEAYFADVLNTDE